MSPVYGRPAVLDELGTSDQNVILLVPACFPTIDTDVVQSTVTMPMGKNYEQAMFTSALSHNRWEYMDRLPTFEEQFQSFQETIDSFLDTCFRTRLCPVIAHIIP